MTILVDEIGGDGCVLCLPFNEGSGTTAYDRSGYNNNGTIYGATWTSGVTGSALYFDGEDDYVNAGDTSSLRLRKTFTLEAWAKPYVNEGPGVPDVHLTVVSKGQYGFVGDPKGFSLYYSNDVWTFGFGDDADVDTLTFTSPSVNTWRHVVITFNNGEVKGYIDGVLKNSKTSSITDIKNDWEDFMVGCFSHLHFGVYYHHFNGIIDSVRIYNRALTDEEIQAHYRGARLLPLR